MDISLLGGRLICGTLSMSHAQAVPGIIADLSNESGRRVLSDPAKRVICYDGGAG